MDANAQERRAGRRARTKIEAQAASEDGRPIGRCVVQDVSGDGARLRVSPDLELPARFRLSLENNMSYDVDLRWRRGASAGVRLHPTACGPTGAERLAIEFQALRLRNEVRSVQRPGLAPRLAELRATRSRRS